MCVNVCVPVCLAHACALLYSHTQAGALPQRTVNFPGRGAGPAS